jgi:F-type H+-transporting ATPase subunit gamma
MAGALEAEGVRVGDRLAAVGSLGAGLTLDREILMRLEGLRERQEPGRIVLAYARTLRGTEIHPVLVELLPLNTEELIRVADTPWPARCLPMVRESWATVFSAVVREFLYAGVFQAVAESHASEHASRLLAMEVAQRRIRDRLQALRGNLNQQRKEAITAELLDLVSGCEAVLSPGPDQRHPSRSGGRT